MCQCPLTMSARCVGSRFCPDGPGDWSPQPGWPRPSPTHTYGGGGQAGQRKEVGKFPPPAKNEPKAGRRPLQASYVWPLGLGLWAGSRAWEEVVPWGEPGTPSLLGQVLGLGAPFKQQAITGHLHPGFRSGSKCCYFWPEAIAKQPWERASPRNFSEDVKRLRLEKESKFPSRLHFGISSMRGIIRSMHHCDKLTLVSKKKKKITLAVASRNEGRLER